MMRRKKPAKETIVVPESKKRTHQDKDSSNKKVKQNSCQNCSLTASTVETKPEERAKEIKKKKPPKQPEVTKPPSSSPFAPYEHAIMEPNEEEYEALMDAKPAWMK
ncbi:predicted protein [Naegleria gruberi]|uniref:Predicted protein n=1 Tax=Naegleria gruberi TaxID=5762 RepID=D2V9V3_NAEGR|nr:uncharacterized protein NAEGRDRAFT_65638 [Naegleria gruberi]EFC46205.1 predicted protein [Naegleria gruberi]|eukprot:XP_002678949.1 predicted protein [Naegleria gruberi strain NEG-M]